MEAKEDNNEILLKILTKLDSLESSMAKVEKSVEQLYGIVEVANDKLTAPQTTDNLGILLERMEKISLTVQHLENIPNLFAMALDSVDEVYDEFAQDDRIFLLKKIINQLGTTENLESLSSILEQLHSIKKIVMNLEQIPNLTAMIVDLLDEFHQQNLSKQDIVENLTNALQIFIQFTHSEVTDLILLTGEALSDSVKNAEKMSIIQSIRFLFNQDARKSLGLLAHFAKLLGKNLGEKQRSQK